MKSESRILEIDPEVQYFCANKELQEKVFEEINTSNRVSDNTKREIGSVCYKGFNLNTCKYAAICEDLQDSGFNNSVRAIINDKYLSYGDKIEYLDLIDCLSKDLRESGASGDQISNVAYEICREITNASCTKRLEEVN